MKIIFLGAPGVGKGTYAKRICPELGIPQISTGDLVRKEIKDGSELGEKIKEYSNAGKLVPDEVITEMLKKRLQEDDTKQGFLLDGFPRTVPQAEMLEQITDMDIVININQRDDIIIKKIAARRVCRDCGDIYNVAEIKEGDLYMPALLPKEEGKCDKCGGEIYQRNDDREEVVKDRLEIYKQETQPLINFYKEKGILKEVQVTGGPEKMVPEIVELLKS